MWMRPFKLPLQSGIIILVSVLDRRRAINSYNAIDYLDWRGDLSFSASPFNEVDAFLCSQIATADFTSIIPEKGEITLSEAFDEYFKIHSVEDSLGVLQSQYVVGMYDKVRHTKRFSSVRLRHQVNLYNKEKSEQFSALTMVIPDGSMVIGFRGTDDTIIGWKEDCNLSVYETVPAQKDALDYLSSEASFDNSSPITICGHSKGGNLSLYSAVKAEKWIRNRIVKAYSFDGPGFRPSFFQSEGYADIQDRLSTYWSQNSLVGVLLESAGKVEIVHSRVFGTLAHDGFNWTVMGTSFQREKRLSDFSLLFEKLTGSFVENATEEEKISLFTELFDALQSSGCTTLTELTRMNIKDTIKFLHSLNGSRKVKEFIKAMVKALGEEGARKIGLLGTRDGQEGKN